MSRFPVMRKVTMSYGRLIKNQESLERVIERFRRLTVQLHYPVEVLPPAYERNEKFARKLGRTRKRTYGAMNRGSDRSE